MPGIVCAIRGGPRSKPTIITSIELALKTGLPLFFLYIVNLDFLVHTSSARVRNITKELQQMGEFILLSAQAKAESHGVLAEGIVRKGNVREEIVKLCHDLEARYIVLGNPAEDGEENIFTNEHLEFFKQRIEAESGAIVILSGEDLNV